jgi:ABC-2 type transport system permease protein
MKKSMYTVWIFTRLSTKRFFRDRLAIFFGILFPLIFLFVFGGISGSDSSPSFNVGVINKSDTKFAKDFVGELKKSDVIKVSDKATTEAEATDLMGKGQLDATIVLPSSFGQVGSQGYPTGQAEVLYTQNNATAGQGLATALEGQFTQLNTKLTKVEPPLTVKTTQSNQKSLRSFDYTFAGLLGFLWANQRLS